MMTWLRDMNNNMYVPVYRFVIELQTRANQISDIPIPGFGYLKGACKCEYARKHFGGQDGGYRRNVTNTEETGGNGGYPDDPPRNLRERRRDRFSL